MKFSKISLVVFVLLITNKIIGQLDYSFYYSYIDSANYFHAKNKIDSTNLYYQKAFTLYKGFDTDYESAIYPYFLEHQVLDTSLIAKAFLVGSNKRDILFLLERRNIPHSKKQIRTIYQKNKLKPKINPRILKRMLLSDQIARRFRPKKMQKVDIKNAKKLIQLMQQQPAIFDHNNLSLKNYGRLEVLLIHAGWKNLDTEFNDIQSLTKEGKLNRLIGASIIERAAIYHGFLFKIDSTGHIKVLENQSKVLCDFFYPNIYFNYGLKFDKKNKQLLFPPYNSNLTEQEVDSMRQFLFLSPLNMLYEQQQFRFVSSDEFCNFKDE
jgi:hypothetical protein